MNSSEHNTTESKTAIFLKALGFPLVLAMVLYLTFRVLWLWDDGYSREVLDDYYALPGHTVDAVYLGASGAREYYLAAEGFHHSGAAVYTLATSNEPLIAAKYLMIEAAKTQQPKVFVIDIRNVTQERFFEGDIRKTTDAMRFSANRIRLIDRLLADLAQFDPDREIKKTDYYFSFSTYHSRWEDVTEEDFGVTDVWLGYNLHTRVKELEQERCVNSDARVPLAAHSGASLRELLSFCRESGTEVLFTITPGYYDETVSGRLNTAADIIREEGVEIWDMRNDADAFGLDPAEDFRAYDHVNTFGAIKFTDRFADMLRDRYDLPDRRGQDDYDEWIYAYEGFTEALQTYLEEQKEDEEDEEE